MWAMVAVCAGNPSAPVSRSMVEFQADRARGSRKPGPVLTRTIPRTGASVVSTHRRLR
jgi:hypothetical protein